MATITLLDHAKTNASRAVLGLIEENIKYSPEVARFPFSTIAGTAYTGAIRTGLPSVGFRAFGEGQTPSKSRFKTLLVQAFPFGGQLEVDKLKADSHPRGAEWLKGIEGSGTMQAALRAIGSQIWYGTVADAKGFPGIKALLPFGGVTEAGDPLTINAAGTTVGTASSVYAVKLGEADVSLVGGNNKSFDVDPWMTQQVTMGDGTKMTAYVSALNSLVGLQVAHENVARRICNLTADAGKGLTDLLLADLLASFPVGHRPDAIFMSRRSCTQLQKSRTVVLQGSGKGRPDQPTLAPRPTEYDGVPIVETDSIFNTDALES